MCMHKYVLAYVWVDVCVCVCVCVCVRLPLEESYSPNAVCVCVCVCVCAPAAVPGGVEVLAVCESGERRFGLQFSLEQESG